MSKKLAALILVAACSSVFGMGIIREHLTNAVPEASTVTNSPPPVVVSNTTPATPTAPTTGATLTIKGVAGRDLLFSFKGWEGWSTSGDTKVIVGQLMMQPDQMGKAVFVDSISTGNIKGGRKTLDNAFGTGGHSLNVSKGERVKVWIKGDGDRKSNVITNWYWPLPGT